VVQDTQITFAKATGEYKEPTAGEKQLRQDTYAKDAIKAFKDGHLEEGNRLNAKFEAEGNKTANDPELSVKDKKNAGTAFTQNAIAIDKARGELSDVIQKKFETDDAPTRAAIKAKIDKLRPETVANMQNFSSLTDKQQEQTMSNMQKIQFGERYGNMSSEEASKQSTTDAIRNMFDTKVADMDKFATSIETFTKALEGFSKRFSETTDNKNLPSTDTKKDTGTPSAIEIRLLEGAGELFSAKMTPSLDKRYIKQTDISGLGG
jgi:hypothetical protein